MEHPIPNPSELLQKLEEERAAGKTPLVSGYLKKENLNQVRVVLKDPTKPITPDNADVFLNGQLLPLVKGISLNLDIHDKIGSVRLDLWAHFTVEEPKGDTGSGGT